jgi:antitoxin (DNA-binding transcriptional repressor) of toxin-antitoxin stability system
MILDARGIALRRAIGYIAYLVPVPPAAASDSLVLVGTEAPARPDEDDEEGDRRGDQRRDARLRG